MIDLIIGVNTGWAITCSLTKSCITFKGQEKNGKS